MPLRTGIDGTADTAQPAQLPPPDIALSAGTTPALVTAARSAAASPSAACGLPSCFDPLLLLYQRRSLPMPRIRVLSDPVTELPPPYLQLLHHKLNMTPTLSRFWNDQHVSLRVLDKLEQREATPDAPHGVLQRWIALQVDKPTHVQYDGAALPQQHPTTRKQAHSHSEPSSPTIACHSSDPFDSVAPLPLPNDSSTLTLTPSTAAVAATPSQSFGPDHTSASSSSLTVAAAATAATHHHPGPKPGHSTEATADGSLSTQPLPLPLPSPPLWHRGVSDDDNDGLAVAAVAPAPMPTTSVAAAAAVAAASVPASASLAAASPAAAAASSSSSSTAVPRHLVEFGSIRIHMSRLPASLRAELWAGTRPFATLLLQHRPHPIQQLIRPQAFFAIEWDTNIKKLTADVSTSNKEEEEESAYDEEPAPTVYGRCNFIFSGDEQLICEVVEIMPPIDLQ